MAGTDGTTTGPAARTKLCIVGDRFSPFADGVTTLSLCAFVAALRAGAYEGELVLTEGQGLTEFDWDRVADELARAGLAGRTEIRRHVTGPLARQTETHKHREPNVLIAGITQVGETSFRAALRLHNDEELLLDHQGGHVQGMVVLEAARQMFLAVSERYHAPRWPEHRYSYVLETMESQFLTFLFPLAATIEYEVLRLDLSDPDRLAFDVRIDFLQAGLPAATVHMACSAIHSDVMAHKERLGATRAVRVLDRGHESLLTVG